MGVADERRSIQSVAPNDGGHRRSSVEFAVNAGVASLRRSVGSVRSDTAPWRSHGAVIEVWRCEISRAVNAPELDAEKDLCRWRRRVRRRLHSAFRRDDYLFEPDNTSLILLTRSADQPVSLAPEHESPVIGHQQFSFSKPSHLVGGNDS